MHKLFSKHQLTVLSLALLVSFSVQAGYSTDPACAAVSTAAKKAAEADKKQVDAVNKSINNAIASTKTCVDAATEAINQIIPDFGGGLLGSILNSARTRLSSTACNYLSDIANSANNAVATALAPISNYTGITPPAINVPNLNVTTPVVDVPAITTRLANTF